MEKYILILMKSFVIYQYTYIQMGKIIEEKIAPRKTITKCAICMEKNAHVTIDCVHKFCMHCITKWANRKNSCPLCRSEIKQIKYGKRIKKVPRRYRPASRQQPSRRTQNIRITWKPVIFIGVPYMNYYYLMNSLMNSVQL